NELRGDGRPRVGRIPRPAYAVYLTYDARLEQPGVLTREDFFGDARPRIDGLGDNIVVARCPRPAVLRQRSGVVGDFLGGGARRQSPNRRWRRRAGREQSAG